MSNVATKARPEVKQPPGTAARAFWKLAQQFAVAAEQVARALRAALVEGGIKARPQETSSSELAAQLGELSEKISIGGTPALQLVAQRAAAHLPARQGAGSVGDAGQAPLLAPAIHPVNPWLCAPRKFSPRLALGS